ncbi:MAG: peptide-methionine (S)-S-oxide reductase MsrA [Burkholderiales bacterium]|nr:peptide-methionine (S)-S-oxide reductase MsrA [Burkholderiales bacterium]
MTSAMATATLGGGCFWCLDAVFSRMKGVISVTSGYCGGRTKNPDYESVCGGETGHAEVVRIEYDPALLSYREILEVFFSIHDPTTLNRQGNDVGSQYRSVIFFHDAEQEKIAREMKEKIEGAVTEIVSATEFYPAEEWHRDYFEKNPFQPYCRYVVGPKVEKFAKKFAAKLKT